MKRLSSAISMVFAFAILAAAMGALVYSVIEDPAVLGPLAAAVVVIAVAIYQRRWEKSQELEKVHREQMTPIYDQVVEAMKDIVAFAARPADEQVAFFRDVSSGLLLHGPSSVVVAWIAWQRSLGVEPYSVPFRAQEKLLLAIRADLGHDDSNLQPGELLRLYVTEEDTDEDRLLWQEIRLSG